MASDGLFPGTVLPNAGKQMIARKNNAIWLDFLENS